MIDLSAVSSPFSLCFHPHLPFTLRILIDNSLA